MSTKASWLSNTEKNCKQRERVRLANILVILENRTKFSAAYTVNIVSVATDLKHEILYIDLFNINTDNTKIKFKF